MRTTGAAVRSKSSAGLGTIHVCSLDRLRKTVERERASHIITLLHDNALALTPPSIAPANHLRLSLHDIASPRLGMVHPGAEHVERILAFVQTWDRSGPMVVHCLAGISRSTATAFITACALNPQADEARIALHLRDLSPTASPNLLLVEHADALLGRQGRMIEAVEAIGYGEPAYEGWPFSLPSEWPADEKRS